MQHGSLQPPRTDNVLYFLMDLMLSACVLLVTILVLPIFIFILLKEQVFHRLGRFIYQILDR